MGRDSLVSEHASLFCIGKWGEEQYGSGTGNMGIFTAGLTAYLHYRKCRKKFE